MMPTSSWWSRPFSSRSALVIAAAVLACGPGAAVWSQGSEVLSADGQWRLRSEPGQPPVLLLSDRGGSVVRRYPARSLAGEAARAVPVMLANPARRSFVISLDGAGELWELSLDTRAEPIFNGWVHDYRMGEGLAEPGYLGLRRTRLRETLLSMTLAPGGAYVLGRARDAADGRAVLQLLNLDVRRAIAGFVVDADPDLAQAQSGRCDAAPARDCLRVPDRRGGPGLELDTRALRLLQGGQTVAATPARPP